MNGSYALGVTILLHNHVRESRNIGEPGNEAKIIIS